MELETIRLEVLKDHSRKARERGFYWVRRLGESRLQVAKWDGVCWALPGSIVELCDDSFSVIGLDRIAIPSGD